jgi:hypothetical protein
VYGFAKNARANINADELKALKYLAKELLEHSDNALIQAVASAPRCERPLARKVLPIRF